MGLLDPAVSVGGPELRLHRREGIALIASANGLVTG